MQGYGSRRDYELAREWMEKHKGADEIVVDTKTGRTVKAAVYLEPVNAYYEQSERALEEAVAAIERLADEEEGR